MRNSLFAAAAAFALVLGTAPTFAADMNGGNKTDVDKAATEQDQANKASSNIDSQCANILANPSAFSETAVQECKSKQH